MGTIAAILVGLVLVVVAVLYGLGRVSDHISWRLLLRKADKELSEIGPEQLLARIDGKIADNRKTFQQMQAKAGKPGHPLTAQTGFGNEVARWERYRSAVDTVLARRSKPRGSAKDV